MIALLASGFGCTIGVESEPPLTALSDEQSSQLTFPSPERLSARGQRVMSEQLMRDQSKGVLVAFLDLGPQLSTKPFAATLTLTNHGRRLHELTWSIEGHTVGQSARHGLQVRWEAYIFRVRMHCDIRLLFCTAWVMGMLYLAGYTHAHAQLNGLNFQ